MPYLMEEIEMEKLTDDCPDLSWLETKYDYDDETGELTIIDSCRYSQNDVKTHGSKTVLDWILQDHSRLESYGQSWYMIGIRAKTTVKIPVNGVPGNFILQEFTSPGLWGIESDSDSKYFQEVFEGEKQILLEMLEAMKS